MWDTVAFFAKDDVSDVIHSFYFLFFFAPWPAPPFLLVDVSFILSSGLWAPPVASTSSIIPLACSNEEKHLILNIYFQKTKQNQKYIENLYLW